MGKQNKGQTFAGIPVLTTIDYASLYDDYDKVTVQALIKDIPTLAILNFVINLQNQVLYAYSAVSTQMRMVRDMCNYLPKEVKQKAWKFQKDHPNISLMNNMSCFLLYGIALQNYVPLEEDDIDLYEEEIEPVYKAILYCNKVVMDIASQGELPKDPYLLSLRADMPQVEFKLFKDFRTQFFKAIKFFEFCENDAHYSNYLLHFCVNYDVPDWKAYLLMLFDFYAKSLKTTSSILTAEDPLVCKLLEQYVIDLGQCVNLDNDFNALQYFRNHFLFKIDDTRFMLLNANFLVDKMYQGLKFDFYRVVKDNGNLNKNGNTYNGFVDFTAELGTVFSEPKLLYPLLDNIFASKCSKKYSGDFLKSQGVPAEPDYYLRIGDTLILFENKDVLISDRIRYSQNAHDIADEIYKKVCKYEGTNNKGVGQLLNTLDGIFSHGTMNQLDSEVVNVKKIFLLIVTNDRAFSALGVNGLVVREFGNIMQKQTTKCPAMIYSPILVDYDSLVEMSYLIFIGKLNFVEILEWYIDTNRYNLMPFYGFIRDNVMRKHVMNEDETNFLYNGIINKLN